MIVVTGGFVARPDSVDQLAELCLAHVRRSRTEPGCVSHGVHRDVEDPLRFTFVEEWADRDALAAHFAVPASREFVRAATALSDGQSRMTVYEATPIRVP
ncbi:MAG: antibiotic biosynthesis monooxygenase [Chloroflexi bacterium]|nr:antibiotic biosynthesis monooxygenase [Chloroflexota bacterium]